MIAKKVAIRVAAKGKVAHLVSYLLDGKGKKDRVSGIAVTNCRSEDAKWAVREMQVIQERNQRAKGDKTYHLVVSLCRGEEASPEVLAEIEEEFARALGFKDHQRISVVHRDTDNLHLHLAINKVHPERLTLHEPFNDYHVCQQLCQRLERRYGLEAGRKQERGREDRRQRGNVAPPAHEKAATMEAVAGVESLIGYVQRSLRDATAQARSWDELHQAFEKAGVTLKARGNGLVVQSGGKTAKASSCLRELSKVALERRFGPFQIPADARQATTPATAMAPASTRTTEAPPATPSTLGTPAVNAPRRAYAPRPLQKGNSQLFKQYQAARAAAAVVRAERLGRALGAHRARVAEARRDYDLDRATLRAAARGPLRRTMTELHLNRLKRRVKTSYETYRAEKVATLRAAPLLAWNDWLMREAARGHQPALAALRSRQPARAADPRSAGHHRFQEVSSAPQPPSFHPSSSHARPDYTQAQRRDPRTQRFRRIAALLQSRFSGVARGRAPGPLAGVRDLPRFDVVRQPESTPLLLHPDAPGRLGPEGSAGAPMRRPGTGLDRAGGTGGRGGGSGRLRGDGGMTGDGAAESATPAYVTRGGTWRGTVLRTLKRGVERVKEWTMER